MLYRLPLTLIKSNVSFGFLAVMQSSYKLIKDLSTDFILLGLCFILGMTLSGYLIRRYWTGKLTGVAVLQATIIESDFSDFQYILYIFSNSHVARIWREDEPTFPKNSGHSSI